MSMNFKLSSGLNLHFDSGLDLAWNFDLNFGTVQPWKIIKYTDKEMMACH